MGRSIWSVASPPRQPTRERLIDASAMLFYEQGFHAIGIDQIIAEVGVTKTTFYNHFESKDDLIVAVLRDRDERDMRALDAELARRGGGPFDQILSVFDVLDDWFSDADFRGCLFINAAVQFPNLNDPVHVAASAHGETSAPCLSGWRARAARRTPTPCPASCACWWRRRSRIATGKGT